MGYPSFATEDKGSKIINRIIDRMINECYDFETFLLKIAFMSLTGFEGVIPKLKASIKPVISKIMCVVAYGSHTV